MIENHKYVFKATVIDVIDGDTCIVDIDLGFGIWVRDYRIRLARINAPELKDDPVSATASKVALESLIMDKSVRLETKKSNRDKYGRYIGEIYFEDTKGLLININTKMVSMGHAKFYV